MLNGRNRRRLIAIVGAACLFSAPAITSADDDDDDDDKHFKFQKFSRGVVEIDQKKALKGRVTRSDRRGFPVTIDAPGSYRLRGNLTVSSPKLDAIEITAENVTLDLNGFSIIGPGVGGPGKGSGKCSKKGPGKAPGKFAGIGVIATGQSNVNVVNGSVVGMCGGGLALDIAASVERVNALDDGGDGVFTLGGSSVTNTTANRNGGGGISVGFGSSVSDSTANRNDGNGISVGNRSTVSNNTANVNGGDGIDTGPSSVVIGNAASENLGFGLRLGNRTGYSNNVASGNNGRNVNARRDQITNNAVRIGTNVCGRFAC